jgi:predicted O-methyltransferase YrrM
MELKTYMRPDHGKVGLIEMCEDVKIHLNKDKITIVEIGSYMGESAEIFAQQFPNATIYCVDPFANGYDESDIASTADYLDVEQQFDLRIKQYFYRN